MCQDGGISLYAEDEQCTLTDDLSGTDGRNVVVGPVRGTSRKQGKAQSASIVSGVVIVFYCYLGVTPNR